MAAKRNQLHPWSPIQVADASEITPLDLNLISFGDAAAIQAVMRGVAEGPQQQQAMACIVNTICAKDAQSFFPGGEDGRRASDFAEGRRFVGNQIVKVLRLNLNALANPSKPTEQG